MKCCFDSLYNFACDFSDFKKNSARYYKCQYRSFATTVSQLKMCDFSGETFKALKCYNFLSATTKQLVSSGEF
jgi:hypothetical protein